MKLLVVLLLLVSVAPLVVRAGVRRPLAFPAQAVVLDQDATPPELWAQRRPPGPPPGRGVRPFPPPGLLRRLGELPPEEREKVLRNNRRFQQLPKERQEELLERFRSFQELPPEQRELIEQRFAIFNHLTPRQREKARELYRQHWQPLPPERRRALIEEFRHLRSLPLAERERHLAAPEVEGNFSPAERNLLRQLISL